MGEQERAREIAKHIVSGEWGHDDNHATLARAYLSQARQLAESEREIDRLLVELAKRRWGG